MENLSKETKELLLHAVAGGGEIVCVGSGPFNVLRANAHDFASGFDGRNAQDWQRALFVLKDRGYIRELAPTGELTDRDLDVFIVTISGVVAASAITDVPRPQPKTSTSSSCLPID